ncbi:paraquat-inducible protein A [Stutzerimonas urumqiensis]|uniref:paraquat-inducible protein A n=1 Tax=Stutzerimonas urumqiensis TaxID=638269 RepID=UPI003BABE5C9
MKLTQLPSDAFEPHKLIACPECDLIMRKGVIAEGVALECPRCHYELLTHRTNVIGQSLALVLTALLLYIPANFLPIVNLSLLGRTTYDTVWTGVLGLYQSGMRSIALVVFLCSMVVPLLKLLCQLFVLLTVISKKGRRAGVFTYRVYHHMRDWGMLEVYLLGILVSIIKLNDMAQLSVGAGLACFVGLLLVQVWLEIKMSPQQVWEALTEQDCARN